MCWSGIIFHLALQQQKISAIKEWSSEILTPFVPSHLKFQMAMPSNQSK